MSATKLHSTYDGTLQFVHFACKFTGKERDTESGNDYFGARYYGSNMGRFMSPDDDSDQIPGDPQSWDLYSYVRNNPLVNTDPDGHDCVNGSNASNGTVAYVNTSTTVCPQGFTYVNGTVDPKSFTYKNGQLGFNISNYADGSGMAASVTMLVGDQLDHLGIDGPENAAVFGKIGNQGMGAIGWFSEQMVWNVAGDAAGRGIGLAVDALRGSRAAVDLADISNRVLRNMLKQNSTTKEIADVVERGVAHAVENKATGGAATEYVDAETGRFVVVDDATKQVLQVSGSGHRPNYLLK
jgi:RHS repeat-associated protein